MKYSAYNLILEVTRRCNMNCKHCLRGNAENQDMTTEVLEKTLQHFDYISSITFTGGEPTLNLPIIQHTLDYCKKHNITVETFFIATNGKENIDELLNICDQWYYYTTSFEYSTPENEENLATFDYVKLITRDNDYKELESALALSSDPYHEPIPINNLNKLMSRAYFSTTKIQDYKYGVIARGRGENIAGANYRSIPTELNFNTKTDIDEIYISANGMILPECDINFEAMGEHSLGNITESNILEKIYYNQYGDELDET